MGCIPTKALVRSAEAIHLARRAREFGFETGDIKVDLAAIQDRRAEIVRVGVERMTRGIESNDAIELIRGEARFESATRIVVNETVIEAPKTIIATGAQPMVPDIPGLDRPNYLVSDGLLELRRLPEHLIIVGGAAVALEFGQIYRRFGSRVTMLVRGERILRYQDEEIATTLEEALIAEGVEILTGTQVVRVEPVGDGTQIHIEHEGQQRMLECAACAVIDYEGPPRPAEDAMVTATGRRAYTDRLGLDEAGVRHGPDGISVDDELRTSAQNIWGVGDVLGGQHARYKYTHVAVEHGLIAAENAMRGAGRVMDYRAAPGAVFTDPEVASVGLTEREALEAGYTIQVGRQPAERIGRARVMGETRGLVKTVAEAGTGKLLGMHICAHNAGELIHAGVVAMNAGDGSLDPILNGIFIHPTMMEGVQSSAEVVGSDEPARMSH